jgi:hypothetical protein
MYLCSGKLMRKTETVMSVLFAAAEMWRNSNRRFLCHLGIYEANVRDSEAKPMKIRQ